MLTETQSSTLMLHLSHGEGLCFPAEAVAMRTVSTRLRIVTGRMVKDWCCLLENLFNGREWHKIYNKKERRCG